LSSALLEPMQGPHAADAHLVHEGAPLLCEEIGDGSFMPRKTGNREQ
jgi:hypothetical protein